MATGSSAGRRLDHSSDSGSRQKRHGLEGDKCGLPATGTLMNNLPYMGEMTFDTRPRRGRKPKKADICHLISKNYGISFPLTYVNHPNTTLVQGHDTSPVLSDPGVVTPDPALPPEEPLNLCLRDKRHPSTTSSDSVLVRPKPLAPPPRSRKRTKKLLDKLGSHPPPHPPPPPSEVSICKFKFTGGVKPTLQEKKMLSVDSGGNFRFYSDKQPSRGVKGQGHLLGCKIPQVPAIQPFPVPQSAGSFQPVDPSELTSPIHSPSRAEDCSSSSEDDSASVVSCRDSSKRKRRTRKSLMRETLEKTFKEKGFLIQTQQLESAEGATYCKFRQLRKFTRYLFRSWKDYLPENVQGISVGDNRAAVPALESEVLENRQEI